MKIYIGIPKTKINTDVLSVKSALVKTLKPYYGEFGTESISEYYNNSVDVYIMDKAKYRNQDDNIIADVKKLMRALYGGLDINVYLNYQQFNPGFNPCLNSTVNAEISRNQQNQNKNKSDEFDYEKLSENYQSETPRYNFNQVILPKAVQEQIIEAVSTIQVEHKVFDEWGLRSIIPNASSAMSFYGPPGTGKSMAAEAIAQKLNKKILRATYADIESKFHGEGPKMVKAIFRAAERDDAVLFLDESDSLLSKRLTNVSDGSAQAINSMRSQLLICLEQFRGIVIFATNLVVNYDKAFLSRLINIEFTVPDFDARKLIWNQHLCGDGLRIPLSEDVNLDELAEKYVFCGREIKNSVKDACVTVAISGRDLVCQADLIKASEKTKVESEKVLKSEDHTKSVKMSDEQKKAVTEVMQKKIDESNNTTNSSELDS
ncbi:MAG: ATP-binding protein [Oscillospiraceae bacterium]|nr:ATP-binding protein [Oscillospiraceae bacterium]